MLTHSASGSDGIVTAPHPDAAAAGAALLAQGGTAVDAAIATNAALGVAMPHMCGIGGDLFAMVDAGGGHGPVAFNASGHAAASVDADRLDRTGGVPPRGLAAVTVPGAVDGWRLMHERFGRAAWASLFDGAVALADRGVAMTELARAWYLEEEAVLRRDPVSCETFLRDAVAPSVGTVIPQPELARTLELLASAGSRALYEGELARKLTAVTGTDSDGLRAADLAAYRARTVPAATATIGGQRLATVPPNSQGATALLLLRALERDTAALPGDAAWGPAFLRAKRTAFSIRDTVLAQPSRLDAALGDHELDAMLLSAPPASAAPGANLAGDTVALAACDAEGRVCVIIQSLYFTFGVGVTVPGTGIVLQNRGAYFNTRPGAPNRIGPGRRPLHTLMPMLAYDASGTLRAAIGTQGGDGQPQVVAQLLLRLLASSEEPGAALAAGRLLHGRYVIGEPDDVVHVEDVLGVEAIAALRDAADSVIVHPWPYGRMGHACAIVRPIGSSSVRTAVSDPRSDGVAIAI